MASGLPRLFTRATAGEAARSADILRREAVGGGLLVLAASSRSPGSHTCGTRTQLDNSTVVLGWVHVRARRDA
jgi:hypothetical protein